MLSQQVCRDKCLPKPDWTSMPAADLLIHAPRVLDPAGGFLDDIQLAIQDGQIVGLGPRLETNATNQIHLPDDAILVPGLIDIHAHPARSGSIFGVDPDQHLLPHGVTTVLSQGDAGSSTIDAYVEETIRPSRTGVKLAINLSSVGESTAEGCLSNPDWIDPDACLVAIRRYPEHVTAIAVNASQAACADQDPRGILPLAVKVAGESGLPLLYGMRPDSEWAFDDQLQQLRPGDLVTYIFRRSPHCIITSEGMVHPAILAARQRGILFDVGHGYSSFDFKVACQAIEQGFSPDTISTDLQKRHLEDPIPHTLLNVMGKLEAAGMEQEAITRAVTSTPAAYLNDPRVPGQLKVGAPADISALRWPSETRMLTDTSGKQMQGRIPELVLLLSAGEQIGP
jgi:dihydroorotase